MNVHRLPVRLAVATLWAAGLVLTACSATPSAPATGSSSGTAAGLAAGSGTAGSTAGSSVTAAGFPVTVPSCGREFTYDRAPERVVLGNQRTLTTLRALGVDDRVMGYVLGPDDRGRPPADLPAGLVMVSPDTIPAREPVIAARPDLFLSFNEAQLVGPGTLSYDDLAGIGANAYVLGAYCADRATTGSIDTVATDITHLGAIFGVPERAAQLNAQLQDRLATAKASLAGATPTVAFLKVVGGKVYAIGGYPASAVTAALGLTNEFGDLPTTFAELSPEQVLAMKPDIVFVNYVGDEQAAIADLTAAAPGLAAATGGRIHGADENLAQGGGVGVIDLVEAIAAGVRGATADGTGG